MGWINRLCIKQLLRALPIARERMRLAREHAEKLGDRADLSDYARKRQRVLDLECSLRARIMLPLEAQWAKLLQEFMAAYEIAAESDIGVPPEVYEIAPLAAAFLHKRGLANSKVAQALLQRDARPT